MQGKDLRAPLILSLFQGGEGSEFKRASARGSPLEEDTNLLSNCMSSLIFATIFSRDATL